MATDPNIAEAPPAGPAPSAEQVYFTHCQPSDSLEQRGGYSVRHLDRGPGDVEVRRRLQRRAER